MPFRASCCEPAVRCFASKMSRATLISVFPLRAEKPHFFTKILLLLAETSRRPRATSDFPFFSAEDFSHQYRSAGFVMNLQPSEAEAGFDIRLPPTESLEVLIKRIEEEWAPISRNMTYQLIQKGPSRDVSGRPLVTPTNTSNPWWSVFKQAISTSGGKLGKPEILSSTTDARFMRQMGIPTLGFSPMANTPILLHDHNEFLKDTVFLNGIKVYENLISALSSFHS